MPTGVTKGAPVANTVAPPKGPLSEAGRAAIRNASFNNESVTSLFGQRPWLSRNMDGQIL